MPLPQRESLAAALHQDRCIRSLYFIPAYLVPSVSKYLQEQGWITPTLATSVLQERVPRPTKKRATMSWASAADAFLTGSATTAIAYDDESIPLAEPMNVDTSVSKRKDFHEEVYGSSDSDDSTDDTPDGSHSQ